MGDLKEIQKRKARKLLKSGVEILDLDKIEIRGKLRCGKNVEIGTNVIIEGDVVLGSSVKVESNTIIISSNVGDKTKIKSFSSIKKSFVGKDCIIGPYARLRTGSKIGNFSQIGSFVEIKNSIIGSNCRINHMAFLGDAKLGRDITIGAGTITCNHDGVGACKTIIESGSYIGSNVNLVAPVKVSANSTIGSGSTITTNVPKGKLTIARARQTTISNWKGPKSKKIQKHKNL